MAYYRSDRSYPGRAYDDRSTPRRTSAYTGAEVPLGPDGRPQYGMPIHPPESGVRYVQAPVTASAGHARGSTTSGFAHVRSPSQPRQQFTPLATDISRRSGHPSPFPPSPVYVSDRDTRDVFEEPVSYDRHSHHRSTRKSRAEDSERRRRKSPGQVRGHHRPRPHDTEWRRHEKPRPAAGIPSRSNLPNPDDSWDEEGPKEIRSTEAKSYGRVPHDEEYGREDRKDRSGKTHENSSPPRKESIYDSDKKTELWRRPLKAEETARRREEPRVEALRKSKTKTTTGFSGLFSSRPMNTASPARAETEPKPKSAHGERVPRSSTGPKPGSGAKRSSRREFIYETGSSSRRDGHTCNPRKVEIVRPDSVSDGGDSIDKPTSTASYSHGRPVSLPRRENPASASSSAEKQLEARERLIKKCKKEVEYMLPVSQKYNWMTSIWEKKRDAFDAIDKNSDNFDAEVKAKRDDFLRAYKQRLLGERSKYKDSADREDKVKFEEVEALRRGVIEKENGGLPK